MAKAGFKNRDRFRRLLKALPEEERAQIRRALQTSANHIVGTQKQLAPVLKEPHKKRRLGALRDSIVATPGNQDLPAYASVRGKAKTQDPSMTMIISAGNSEVRYAHLVENGTHKMMPQPYFRPGFRAHKAEAVREIKKAVKQAVRNAVRKRSATIAAIGAIE